MMLAANVAEQPWPDVPVAASRVAVLPSTVADVYALAANLRPEDSAEVDAMGVDVRTALRRNFRHAILRKTYWVDGEIAAMSGLCGEMLADIGRPYLLTAPAAERVPIAFIKHAKSAVAEMLHHRLRLEGYVAANYTRACRMLEMVGFTLGKPESFGPRGALFRSFTLMRGA